jgi:predicted regulator of Ras-like GTPase activity (Roadblock/LC7/MglB family)
MNTDLSTVTLKNAMKEIKEAYTKIKHSFIFSENGTIISGDPTTDEEKAKKIMQSFEILKDKTEAIGKLQAFQINGKKGKLIISTIQDRHLVLETTKTANKIYLHAITHLIIPTLLRTIENIDTASDIFTSTKELVVETLTGFFTGNAVQIDAETLTEWKNNSDSTQKTKDIKQVKIDTQSGKKVLYPVKKINDVNRRGKNLIRIPNKLLRTLEVNEGEMVRVKPA